MDRKDYFIHVLDGTQSRVTTHVIKKTTEEEANLALKHCAINCVKSSMADESCKPIKSIVWDASGIASIRFDGNRILFILSEAELINIEMLKEDYEEVERITSIFSGELGENDINYLKAILAGQEEY